MLHADRREAVGHENHRRRTVPRDEVERRGQAIRNVRAAGSVEALDVVDRRAGTRARLEAVAEHADRPREADDGESIVVAEPLQDVRGGGARLLDLLALHRTGGVEDEHDVASDGDVDRQCRREEQREHTVVARLPIGQRASVDQALAAGDVDAEVRDGAPRAAGLPAHTQLAG